MDVKTFSREIGWYGNSMAGWTIDNKMVKGRRKQKRGMVVINLTSNDGSESLRIGHQAPEGDWKL